MFHAIDPVFNTLFRKLIAVLVLFGLLMCLIFAVMMRYSHDVYHQEIQQKYHAEVAARFATLAGWTPSGWGDRTAAESALARLVTLSPQFHIFLLDRNGRVVSHFPNATALVKDHVDLQPIQRFLSPKAHFPILGDDPIDSHEQRIFSVVHLPSNQQAEQYLYVTLRSEEHAETAEGLRLSYITRDGVWLASTCVLLALLGGLLSLHFVVRPLKQLAAAMERFRQSQFKDSLDVNKRPVTSGDEIDELTTTFYRMAEQMQAQMRELEQADANRREFIANISHDLRTPLASIQGYLDTMSLKNGALTPEERHQYLQIALNQVKSLSQLINTLFYLAKLDSEQIGLQLEEFRIEEAVQDLVQKFALQARRKNIELKAEIGGKLPFVCADLGLIDRALSNLIDNALRHTPEGGIVQITLNHKDGKVWVSVVDSGPGIAAKDLPHVFERFYRGTRAREDTGANAGLGLSIVQRILNMHNELIEVANAPKGGAVFRFTLTPVSPSLLTDASPDIET